NIPGVAGIGEKTASALVSRLGPVEQILERLDEVETIGLRGAKKVRETLAREAESARLSKALATIRCDVPITLDLEAFRWEGPDPALGDLAVAKLGGDLKTLRVALARRGIALAGPTFDVSLASYCLNPTRADHGVAALAEELLGEARAPDGDPAETACRAARAAHRLKPALEELLRAHEMERLFRDLEMPLASVLADMELAGVALDVAALGRLSTEMGAELERLVQEFYALAGR